jgi:hypothetical protein
MNAADILRIRLERQLIAERTRVASPAQAVEHLCAMQAQDYLGSLWAVGQRCSAGTTDVDVERAIAERRIVRTWPMRGTLHLVAAADVRWLLALLAPRIVARAANRHAGLGLTDADFARAHELFADALAGGRSLTRPDAMALLADNGIDPTGQRGYHVLWMLSQDALLCCGPNEGKQQTFVLLDDWIPRATAEQDAPPRDVALPRLAERYFAAHGPATVEDLAWWSGLNKTETRAAIAGVDGGRIESATVGGREYWAPTGVLRDGAAGVGVGRGAASNHASGEDPPAGASPRRSRSPGVHLLPGFDEYLLGYTDRRPQMAGHYDTFASMVSANGMLSSTVVIDGEVHGIWKRTLKRDRVDVRVRAFRPLAQAERLSIAREAERYGAFLGRVASVEFSAEG